LFHELSVLHDYDALAHQTHDLNIVADEQVGETEIHTKPVEEAKDRVLDGDVQRRSVRRG
jgi:hypothetical protein